MKLGLTGLAIMFLMATGFFILHGGSCKKYTYKTHIVFPGTRSEGRVKLLLYEDEPILPYVREIKTPIGRFYYEYRRLPFEKEGVGWQRISSKKERQSGISLAKITEDELERGWYMSAKQKTGTPDTWIWVPSYKKWVSPKRINDHEIYARSDWKYVVELKDRDNWSIQGSLFRENVEIKGTENGESIITPIGEFIWNRRPHTEDGWIRK